MNESSTAPRPPLPTYDEALSNAIDGVEPLGTEFVDDFAAACGRVLRTPIVADRDQPPFNRVAMDGYAVRAADIGHYESFEDVGEIAAGAGVKVEIGPGRTARIATGAPLPGSADSVIPHELSDRKSPVRFKIDRLEPGASVHARGSDARAGEVVVPAGIMLRPQHVGIAAAVGAVRLEVAVRPRVAVITTGDEVLPPDSQVAAHQIRNSNGPMLRMFIDVFGAEPTFVTHVPDDPELTIAAVHEAIERCDVIMSTGGVSAGRRDYLPDAYAAAGVETRIRGAAIQPGKPIFVGAVNAPRGRVCQVIGLPGNPVSVLATACLFAWPIIRRLLGVRSARDGAAATLPWTTRTLSAPVAPNSTREAFRPARERRDGRIEVIRWSGSGDLMHTAGADGLARLPMQSGELAAGAPVDFLPMPWRCDR